MVGENALEPILFVFTGPSGAGKGSVMRALLERDKSLHKVVTYTTRQPRDGEVDGFDYRFVSVETFRALIDQGKLFEYEQVYQDHYYGSPNELFIPGHDGIIELDYKGRLKYTARRRRVVGIFLLPPSLEVLRERILSRSRVENLSARLANAVDQIRHAQSYDYIVKNDNLEDCIARVESIIQAERCRRQGQMELKAMLKDLKGDMSFS